MHGMQIKCHKHFSIFVNYVAENGIYTGVRGRDEMLERAPPYTVQIKTKVCNDDSDSDWPKFTYLLLLDEQTPADHKYTAILGATAGISR